MHIPLTKPFWGKKEQKAVAGALRHSSGTGDGPYSKILVQKLRTLTHAQYIFPVTSCTHGLELALWALRLVGNFKEGDEVILPSFTMSSTANAVLMAGLRPVFADIDPHTYMIDPSDMRKRVTSRTRGLILVHYAGMPCDMEHILDFAKKHKFFIVEDAAHAIGATYKGKSLGTFGDIGVYSFHGTKNISCGEGGAVLTNSKILAKHMEVYRANGTNRNAFLRGEINKYSWVEKGSSYFLSDILASIVNTQLDQINKINNKRSKIASIYTKFLSKYTSVLAIPIVPAYTMPNWHIYAIQFQSVGMASLFVTKMRKAGVEVSYHYVPLHSSVMGKRLLGQKQTLKNTQQVSGTLVRLPIYPSLSAKELSYIISTAQRIFRS